MYVCGVKWRKHGYSVGASAIIPPHDRQPRRGSPIPAAATRRSLARGTRNRPTQNGPFLPSLTSIPSIFHSRLSLHSPTKTLTSTFPCWPLLWSDLSLYIHLYLLSRRIRSVEFECVCDFLFNWKRMGLDSSGAESTSVYLRRWISELDLWRGQWMGLLVLDWRTKLMCGRPRRKSAPLGPHGNRAATLFALICCHLLHRDHPLLWGSSSKGLYVSNWVDDGSCICLFN